MKILLQSRAARGDRRGRGRRAPAGLTLVELVVVFAIMSVALGMYASTTLSVAKMRSIHRENALASEAARTVIETMRNQPWRSVYPLFNSDPLDDPGGPGTAPGCRFDVSGLQAAIAAEAEAVGEIVFPTMQVEVAEAISFEVGDGAFGEGLVGGSSTMGGGFGTLLEAFSAEREELQSGSTTTVHQLREDFVDARLGLPRDLNGDNVIDDLDHANDYVILPVCVRVTWQGRIGPQTFEMYTMLTEFRRRP